MTVVAILGMHRSGTSWLAGSLQSLGLELGEVNTQAPNNAKGNRESDVVREIHEGVLKKNDGNWRRVPATIEWPRKARKQLAKHIESMDAGNAVWGFKDPRSLLMLDQWRELANDIVYVGIYRHPLSVFKSLHKRQESFTEEEAVALWRRYNEALLAEYARAPFPIMRFDVDAPTLVRQLKQLVEHIGLPADSITEGSIPFLDESLIHNADAADAPIPDAAKATWDALQAASIVNER